MNNAALPPKEREISETTENYLKRIYILIETKGKARTSDIAKLMGRTLSSVSEAVKRMSDEGLLHYEKYGKITLTEEGEEIATSVHNNYSTLNDLLTILGLPEPVAMEDACSMEHSISPYTVDTLAQFVEFVKTNDDAKKLIDEFIKNNPVEMPDISFDDDEEEED